MLIGAAWLLLLATALVALLMLHARTTAHTASREELDLQRELDFDAAIQTVAAELLIEGPASRWWRLPGQGSVALGGRTVDVTVTSEPGGSTSTMAIPQ